MLAAIASLSLIPGWSAGAVAADRSLHHEAAAKAAPLPGAAELAPLTPELRARLERLLGKPARTVDANAPQRPAAPSIPADALCNLTWYQQPGWYQPVVAYDLSASPPSGAPPLLLIGDAAQTHVTYGLRNSGAAASGIFSVNEMLDGRVLAMLPDAGLDPLETRTVDHTLSVVIPGGRHTMGIAIDATGGVAESSEGDNQWAGQWVWAPQSLTMGVPVVRSGVPDPTGGHAAVPAGTIPAINLDGVRSPDFHGEENDGFWGVVGVVPQIPSDDVDMALFTPSTGPTNGFANPLRFAGEGAGATDLVLVDADPGLGLGGSTGPRDIGTSRVGGTEATSYVVECQPSEWIGLSSGIHGPRQMNPGSFVRVFEFFFDGGNRNVVLQNIGGQADLGMAVIRRTTGHGGLYGRAEFITLGLDCNAHGPGGDELAVMSGRPAAYYAIVVWKTGASELGKTALFQLRLTDGVTGVEEEAPPRATALRITGPNPAREGCSFEFDLEHESRATLFVHDLSGRKVATVADEACSAGTHRVRWNGRDDEGCPLPDGLYFVRFEGAGARMTRKLAIVR